MASLESFLKKRSFAKKNFIFNHNKLLPLVKLYGTEACDSLQDVKDCMRKVEGCYSVFVKAHDSYVEELESKTLEKDVEAVSETQFEYFNVVESNFIALRKLYNKYIKIPIEEIEASHAAFVQKKRALESIPSLKLNLLTAIDQYIAVKINVS